MIYLTQAEIDAFVAQYSGRADYIDIQKLEQDYQYFQSSSRYRAALIR